MANVRLAGVLVASLIVGVVYLAVMVLARVHPVGSVAAMFMADVRLDGVLVIAIAVMLLADVPCTPCRRARHCRQHAGGRRPSCRRAPSPPTRCSHAPDRRTPGRHAHFSHARGQRASLRPDRRGRHAPMHPWANAGATAKYRYQMRH